MDLSRSRAALFLAFSLVGMPAWAQGLTQSCHKVGVSEEIADRIDTALAGLDHDRGAAASPRSVACASLPWPGASLIAVAIAGSDDRSGGVAILRASDDSILQVDTYRSAREPIAVGTRRLLISYTESADLLGAGQYESHYILLCGLAPDVWVECLDLVKDRTVVWMGDDPPRSVEQRNHLTIRGDSAVYSRQVTIRESSGKAPVHQELGKVTLALPQLH